MILDVLLPPLAAPVATRLLLYPNATSPWNVTAGKTWHVRPYCLHDDPNRPNGLVLVLKNSGQGAMPVSR